MRGTHFGFSWNLTQAAVRQVYREPLKHTDACKQEERRAEFSPCAHIFPQEVRDDFFLSEMSCRLIKAEQPVSVHQTASVNQHPHISSYNNNSA